MTLQKALRAKNSGVFMDSIQVEVLRNGFTAEVKSALSSPPRMKWGPYTEMQKLGCLAWSDGALTSELGEHAKRCIETEELNTALIGALFMFGVGATEAAIECSERAFESAEASGDYEFHAGLLVSTLVKGGCDWSGAPDGVYHVRVDKTYAKSTLMSVAEDFRASGWLFKEQYVLDLASGLAKSAALNESLELLIEYSQTLEDFSACDSYICSLSATLPGFSESERSLTVQSVPFADRATCAIALEKAGNVAGRSERARLKELQAHVEANF